VQVVVDNPVCGDSGAFSLAVVEAVLQRVRFEGHGCAVSLASMAIAAHELEARPVSAAHAWLKQVTGWMRERPNGRHAQRAGLDAELGAFAALEAVRGFPIRIRCMAAPVEALIAGLEHYQQEKRG
jgi:nitrogen fixation NifU-like protein